MKKYFATTLAYNLVVFVDSENKAVAFDCATLEEAKAMDVSGIAGDTTAEQIAHDCSKENDIFDFNEDDFDSLEELPLGW